MKTLLLLILSCVSAQCANVTLAWDPVTLTNVAGYKLFWGMATRSYAWSNVTARASTTSTVTNLAPGQTYYFAATVFLDNGLESDYSAEVSYLVPIPPPANLRISLQSASAITGPWTNQFSLTPIQGGQSEFYRLTIASER